MLRRDATAMVERMAGQARRAGLEHPVAAAVALFLRVGQRAGLEQFAERTGGVITRLVEVESGAVRFCELPSQFGSLALELEIDLLSLADLERERQRLPADDRNRSRPALRNGRDTRCLLSGYLPPLSVK